MTKIPLLIYFSLLALMMSGCIGRDKVDIDSTQVHFFSAQSTDLGFGGGLYLMGKKLDGTLAPVYIEMKNERNFEFDNGQWIFTIIGLTTAFSADHEVYCASHGPINLIGGNQSVTMRLTRGQSSCNLDMQAQLIAHFFNAHEGPGTDVDSDPPIGVTEYGVWGHSKWGQAKWGP